MKDNKLIAEFMGLNIDKGVQADYMEQELKYHRSWDWIMPVVHKMELMGCVVKHHHGDCIVYKIDEKENYRCIIDIQGVNKLNSTYKAVVEFIKNHKIL
tara:strand:+ start:1969 stop:2265 length:297 start_codon:yes stop_codon:yes gene_type:complete